MKNAVNTLNVSDDLERARKMLYRAFEIVHLAAEDARYHAIDLRGMAYDEGADMNDPLFKKADAVDGLNSALTAIADAILDARYDLAGLIEEEVES